MAGSSVINYKGKRIVFMDLSNTTDYNDSIAALKQAEPMIRKEQPGSVLTILDISNSPFNREITNYLREFAEKNKPYVKMTVVTGVDGMKRIVVDGVIMFTRRTNIVTKDNNEQAKDYLASL